jgi:hypothetical protein
MNNKQESTMAIAAAILVLFSAMVDPIVSVILSLSAFLGFAVYKFGQKKRK